MTRLELPDYLAASHNVASVKCRRDRFVAREQAIGVRDRQHRAVDHHPGKMHYAIGRREDIAGRCDVDAPMPSRVLRRWGDERSKDRMRATHRPVPWQMLNR
jgi:hypothetical protein